LVYISRQFAFLLFREVKEIICNFLAPHSEHKPEQVGPINIGQSMMAPDKAAAVGTKFLGRSVYVFGAYIVNL
jgi:hypothetical protein